MHLFSASEIKKKNFTTQTSLLSAFITVWSYNGFSATANLHPYSVSELGAQTAVKCLASLVSDF